MEKGNPCYVMVECLATLLILGKRENILNEFVNTEICRQNVASTNWFLLASYDKM